MCKAGHLEKPLHRDRSRRQRLKIRFVVEELFIHKGSQLVEGDCPMSNIFPVFQQKQEFGGSTALKCVSLHGG